MDNKTSAKLENILQVLQNLFILEAMKAGISSGEIRNILKINQNRIGAISKHMKVSK